MFTEMLQAEVWRKKLEAAGYKVVGEAWDARPRRTTPGADGERRSRPSIAPDTTVGH